MNDNKLSRDSLRIAYHAWRYLFFESKSFKALMQKWKKRYESGEIDDETAGKSMVEAAAMASKIGHKIFETRNQRQPETEEKMEINDAVEVVQEFITYWSKNPPDEPA